MIRLFPFEIKKLLINKAAFWTLIVALLALLGFFYMHFSKGQLANNTNGPYSTSQAITRQQKNAKELSGTFSKERIEAVFDNYVKTRPDFGDKDLYNVFGHMIISRFVKNANDKLVAIHTQNATLDSLKPIEIKTPEEVGLAKPFKDLQLGQFATWNALFLVLNSAFIVLVLLVLFIVSPLFSGEVANQMNPLLLTSRYGRNKLILAKLSSLFAIGTGSFLVYAALILTVFGIYFGWQGWDTSVQLNLYWTNSLTNMLAFPETLNLAETLGFLLGFQYSGLIIVLALSAFISSLTKSSLVTFGLSALVFIVPYALEQAFQTGLLHRLLMVFSTPTLAFEDSLLTLAHPDGFWLKGFFGNSSLLITLRLALTLAFCYLTYHIMAKKKE